MITIKKITPEGAVKRSVKQYLRMRGWRIITIMQGPLSERGVSDLICIKNGKVIFCEVKAPNGKQSEHQLDFQKSIEFHGGIYLFVRSLDDLLNAGY